MKNILRPINLLKKLLSKFRSLSLKEKIIVIIVLVIVAFFAWNRIRAGSDNQYVMAEVTRATITQTVSEIGNVEYGASINVTSPSNGKVEEVLVSNGDKVTEDQELVKIKSTATEQEQQAAYSDYLAAITTLNTAKSNLNVYRSAMYDEWDTYRSLATNGTYGSEDGDVNNTNREAAEFQIAQDDWLASEAKYKDQSNAVAQAQAKVNSTRILYEATKDAVIKATSDGIIANLAVTKGSGIELSDSILFIVSEGQDPIVGVAINEIDIAKVKVNQKAEVDIDAINEKAFNGVVERIDSVGTNTQGVITYNVFVRFSEKDPLIRSAMTANVKIFTETKENVLSVPNNVVKPYQGDRAVQVLKNNKPKYIPVKIGIRGDEKSEIVEGLSDGQEIIVGAKNDLIKRSGGFGF